MADQIELERRSTRLVACGLGLIASRSKRAQAVCLLWQPKRSGAQHPSAAGFFG